MVLLVHPAVNAFPCVVTSVLGFTIDETLVTMKKEKNLFSL